MELRLKLEETLPLDLEKVRKNVQAAETEDLLDRATVYRNGMEPAALDVIDAELRSRGVDEAAVAAHAERRGPALVDDDGLVRKCEKCTRPGAVRVWAWHRLWGVVPLFPRLMNFCEVHSG
jgi:hypothetical protein